MPGSVASGTLCIIHDMCLPLGKCCCNCMISIHEPKRYNTNQVPNLIRIYEISSSHIADYSLLRCDIV
jgi:hypothetical protein